MSNCCCIHRPRGRFALAAFFAALTSLAVFLSGGTPHHAADAAEPAGRFEPRKGDRIAVIGNTLADRMQHDGWLETLLHSRFPGHELVVRDMGFSGDEVAGFTSQPDGNRRLRSAAFGSSDHWLNLTKADVVFAFFGYN